jgi:hypothetical protein
MIKTSASLRDVIKYLANQTHPVRVLTADGAVPIKSGVVEIAKTSAAALTIAAPTTAQNGTVITILNSTAYAHVVTFTGSTLNNGTSAAKTTITFPTYVGGSFRIISDGGKWYLNGLTAATVS